MPAATRNTVDRLDKPSAYYLGRVSHYLPVFQFLSATVNSADQERSKAEQEAKIW